MYKENELAVGILEQTAFNTPATNASAFRKMLYKSGTVKENPSFSISYNDTVNSEEMMQTSNRVKIDSVNGYKRVGFEGLATVKSLSDHLQAWFQRVTEEATTPYRKFWQPLSTPLSFNAGNGTVYSVGLGTRNQSIVPDGVILENAIIEELTLSISPLEQAEKKLMTMKGTWLGTSLKTGQNFTSNWVNEDGSVTDNYVPTYYNESSLPFDFDSADLVINSVNFGGCYSLFEMTMKHEILATNCLTSSGTPNEIILGVPSITYKIQIPYNATTYTALNNFLSGHVVTIANFQNQSDATLGGLKFQAPNCYLTSNPNITKDGYRALELNFKMFLVAGTSTVPILMSDAIDKGW